MIVCRRFIVDPTALVSAFRGLPHPKLAAAAFTIAALGFGGCAQQPQQMAAAGHGKEYFPSSIYGAASRRVIADGQPVPRGGGQYLVGKPYTIAGQTYYPSERKITQVGLASWYGDAFHGRLTANGEVYDRNAFSAAHPTMPLPSYARVTNLRNNASMIVRVNDRGPYHSNRVMDVSSRVADALDFKRTGTARIKVEYVGHASLAGSDDAKLYATLRTDGPARWRGDGEITQVAEAAPAPARVASLAPYAPPAPRYERVVEQERPESLAEYRAPRPAPRRFEEPRPRFAAYEAPQRAVREREQAREERIDDRRGEMSRRMPSREFSRHDIERALEDRDDRTSSFRKRNSEADRQPTPHFTRVASREDVRTARFAPSPVAGARGRTGHSEPSVAAKQGRMAHEAILPPSRPSHLSVVPPARPGASHRQIGLRLARSRDD